jgi:hypothetical protein
MIIHKSYPDADGNPGKTVCGKQSGSDARWRKTQTPNCPLCINGGHDRGPKKLGTL